ncbi:MAG: OmpA family protein [Prolixibacteraceae bacterium]|jgi:peptidoglycan-associated lipoprotein|nr:OmpA family protein [Prolixibacteraceae bacterium]
MQNKAIRYICFSLLIVILSGCSASRFAKNGREAYKIGEYSDAIDHFMKAYRKEKDLAKRTEYDYYMANAYWYLDDYGRAGMRIRNLIRREYPDSSLILKMAHALRYEEKFDDAIENYEQFLELYPNNQEALNGLESCEMTPVWLENPTRHEVNREPMLNSRQADFSPWFVGGLDNSVVLTSSRDGAQGRKKSAITGEKNTDLFRSNFDVQKQRWERPKLIEEEMYINTGAEEGAASFTSDGSTMYFTRCDFDKSGEKGASIFMATRSKDAWSDAENIGILPDSLVAAHPSVSHDGLTLYFVSDMEGGYGGKDIWKVEKMSDTWSEPKNMGPQVNTPGDEMFPLARDNGELYFSSDYHVGMGGLDIFKATYNEESQKWAVENLQAPINSTGDDFSITFIPGRDQGMLASNRKGAIGDDLFSFILPPKIFRAEGEIINSETDIRVEDAYMRLIGTDGTMLKVRSQDGKFQYRLNPETEYILAAFKEGFLNAKQIVNTESLPDSKTFDIKLQLTPTDVPVRVDNINYEFGKAELLPEAKNALDSLVNLLSINPTIVIEIMSHTDYVGSVMFNSELSQRRAQGVVNYLIQRGVNPKRLVAKGYGETWAKMVTRKIARQYDFLNQGDELTEDFILKLETEEQQEIAKAINRRTEFRVLSNDFRENYGQ